MKKWIIGLCIALLGTSGIAYAAETVAPTIADVYKLLTEVKADLNQLKADGFTKANVSGKLATATTKDGKIAIEVTSLLAGPDAAVIGIKVTNNGTTKVNVNTSFETSVTAVGQKIEVLEVEGFLNGVLPNTSASGVILTRPLPKGAAETVFRTALYDGETYMNVLEPVLTIAVPK